MKTKSFCESPTILYLFSGFFAFFAFLPHAALGSPLSLEAYLDEVLHTSPGVEASQELIVGSEETSAEKNLPIMPKLTFQGAHTIDERQFSNSFLGGRTIADNYSVAIEQQTNFGLDAKLSYGLLNNNSTNLPAIIFPNGANNYTSGQTELDITQSLWRNFFGKETRALQTVNEASSLATHYAEKFRLKQTIATAETAYHSLAVANELVKLQQDLLDRSKQILDWNSKRVRNHLTDRVDELQSQASFQSRQLDLISSKDSVRSSILNFNALRNETIDTINEEVVLPSPEFILSLVVPVKAEVTDDIKAAEQNERYNKANNELALQKAQPDLLFMATAAFNGVDPYSSAAIKSSFTTDNPYYMIGFKFTFPIYFWETSEMRSGRVKQQLSAEHVTVQKKLDTDQIWSDLSRRFGEARDRLKLANDLVSLQKEKLEYEKHRLDLGRTTTYQVLVFEQDYALALIARLTIEQEILNIHSQLKTYAKD